MIRKLPAPQEVEYLYWFEEWGQERIRREFGLKNRGAVATYMKRHGIPTRKGGRRLTGICKVENCNRAVCRIKRWANDRVYYTSAPRCFRHEIEFTRTRRRNYMRGYLRRQRPILRSHKGTLRPIRETVCIRYA